MVTGTDTSLEALQAQTFCLALNYVYWHAYWGGYWLHWNMLLGILGTSVGGLHSFSGQGGSNTVVIERTSQLAVADGYPWMCSSSTAKPSLDLAGWIWHVAGSALPPSPHSPQTCFIQGDLGFVLCILSSTPLQVLRRKHWYATDHCCYEVVLLHLTLQRSTSAGSQPKLHHPGHVGYGIQETYLNKSMQPADIHCYQVK